MKKAMLVMMASLFCANVAFAEVKTGSYAVVADDIASGAQITSVEGITMTFGTSETWTSGSGKVTVDGTAFNVYASTSENCSPTSGAIPTVGPYVVFTPQFNGTVTGIVSNAGNNKKGYIVKDEDNNLVNGTVLIDGAEVAWESGTPYNSAAKYNGGVTFEVEAGSTYYFYMAGSKMRFTGFIYTYEEVEAEPETPETEEVQLTADIFKAWDGVGANAQATGAANCESHIGEEVGAGAMVYGTSTVYYLSYADLSAYSKMVIEGTPGVQLRVMLNRLVDEGTVADGNLTEVNVTIGEDGKATVDFAAYEFVHLNAIKTGWGSAAGTITKIALVKADPSDAPAEGEVMLSTGIFKAWDGVGADAQATGAANCELHVGEQLGAGAMVYGTSTVYYLSYADLSAYSKMVIEGTPGVQLRVMINRLVDEGTVADGKLTEINVTIAEDGKAEIDFSAYEFVHLNAIKTGWGSAAGTISKIYLVEAAGISFAKYEKAVADAEAFKATLNAEDVIEADIIMVMDEAIAGAAQWLEELKAEGEYLQEDVDMIADDLNANTAKWNAYMNMKKAEAAAQEVLMRYPEESRVDNAGLVDALRNLPLMVMWETAESLQAHADGVNTACAAFEKENNQLILDAAKKKAADYAATLDASEETGTMVQIEAYNGLTYMTSDDFFTESGVSADSYDMVMSYSQQIDMMIAQYDPVIQKEKSMMAATKAAAAAQEAMASYDNATDEAGLADAIAKVNEILGELNMWDTMYTLEDLNAAVDALAAARVAFEKENGLDTGTYWLKNVASGKFITAGEHWGTCAVFGEHGLDFELALQEDGTYTIDSKLSNGGESHYFGAEGWMDAAVTKWNIVRMPGGAYSISADGANFLGYDEANVWNAQTKVSVNMTDNTAEAAQWIIMSKDKMIASLEGASVANPADATFFISCANFGRNDTRFASAWQGGPARGGNNDNMAGEKWNTNFDVYQDLAGLPNGYYKLSAQGYYRAGNGGATGMERNAYLYAGANKTPLVNINTEAGNSVFEGGNVSTVAGKGIVPNNMATACTGFTAGLYADNSVIVEVTDGTLRIGVKKDVLIGADWTMFDNFELTYYGTELPPVVADGTYYMKNVASGKFLNGGNSWGTQASLLNSGLDVVLAYSNGTYTIDTNVPNGASRHFLGSNGYVDSDVANWKVVPVGENYAITLDGVNYIGSDGSSIVNLALTDATDAAAQWQLLTKDELVAALDGATEANPGNATFFIVGQNFNRGDANRNAVWQGSPTFGKGNHNNWCAEKWNTNFDVYQDLAGLPNGYYELSAQAFYRAGNGGTTGLEQNAYLYAGINSTPVLNILAEAGNAAIAGNTSDVPGYGLVPNAMESAGDAFKAGLYAGNKVVALVTDGTLRVGIKKDVLIDADWTIFDNFQLAYLGTAVPSVFADAVDSLNAAIADANAWKATLDATNEMDAQVIAQIEQGMLPAAQAVVAQPASIAQIEQMIADVNMFVAQTSMTLGQMKAAEAQAFLAEYDNPEYYTEEFTAAFNEVFNIANGLATGAYTWADLDAALTKMNEAKETFVIQNVPAPAVYVIGAINGHRLVELTSDHVVETKIFYSYDEAMTEPAIYTAPIMVSETATVYAYAMFIDEATRERYISQKVAFEVAAGDEIVLNEPVIKETEEGLVITSNQSGVIGEPEVSIEYAFYPMTDIQTGELASTASESGAYTEALAGLGYGQLIAKAVAFGYTTSVAIYNIEPAKVAYLCGATETTEAIYTALVNDGDMRVVPMNYDDVTLTEETANELAANYDLVVLAGNTGSGTNLAKSANLLVGKVNVLSTKSFWYKHYGTNGSNPGTADTPSRSLTKTVADHPIFAGIEGDEFEVFNDMAKETGRYLQGNGSFNDAVGLTQTALAQTNGTDCIGEGWLNNKGYVIIPVDGIQPEGYLTAAGEALFVNAAWYLIAGEQYAGSGSVTDNPFGIEVTTTEEIQWPADIYDLNGRMVKKEATSLEGLQKGLYLIEGLKVNVK
ncbi:MAG: hypothetical protein IKK67_01170 [Bacteroidaceae bacterium]|nr:hypothetical protein [Bacteroidaceae bacterium]